MNLPQSFYTWKQHKLATTLQEQLEKMTNSEIIDAFSENLTFGTAGLRGIVGPGTNRINEYTIIKTTKAFIAYLLTVYQQQELEKKSVVIAHDNRHFSEAFALLTAKILAANNITAYLFHNNELRPTPLLSFTIKKLNAAAGIVITASHNPPAYNGYKIYDASGSQPLPDVTNIISAKMALIADDFNLEFAYNSKLIKEVPLTIEAQYRQEIKNLQLYPNQKRNVKIVYSSLHGTARDWVIPILQSCGYEVIVVKEQSNFDPYFSGVVSPNPEVKATFALAIAYAKKHQADLVILNDPDADRIGIAVYHNGTYHCLNGNETAPILLKYLLSHYQKKGLLTKAATMYNTFVSGTLADVVAKSYGCQTVKTHTGFKWIAAAILKGKTNGEDFVFAFEEAYGYLIKDINLDKDGIQSAMVLAEACWYYLQKNKTLITVLTDIYEQFGYYYFYTVNIVLSTSTGQKRINDMISTLQDINIESLADVKIIKTEDYRTGLYNMPGQNLMKFYGIDGSWFAVRPSGTEPKLKIYFVCIDKTTKDAQNKMHRMFKALAIKYLNLQTVEVEKLLHDN